VDGVVDTNAHGNAGHQYRYNIQRNTREAHHTINNTDGYNNGQAGIQSFNKRFKHQADDGHYKYQSQSHT